MKKENKIKFISLLTISVLFFGVQNSQAAINSQINYQGKLTDALGVAKADGNYDMILTIYDAASGGNCVWTARGTCGTPTARSVALLNGIFSIMLGDTGAGDTALTGLDFNSPYYLGVTVGADAEMTDRKPIGASAYSFNSSLLNGLSSKASGADAHILATDSSGNATISGSTYFNGTTYYVNSSGTGNLNGLTLAGDLAVNGNDITSTGALTVTPAAGSNFSVALSTTGDFVVNTNQFYVDTSVGKIGIGNASPSVALHIGTTAPTNLGATADSLMVSGGLEVAGSAYLGPMEFPTDSGAISWIDLPVSASAAANAAESYTARVGGTNILTVYGQALGSGGGGIVSGSGRIGIGTTTPSALLHLATATTALGLSVFEQASADTDSFDLILRKTRGTIASPTVITAGDELGNLKFSGYSGVGGYVTSASIKAISEGTVATTRVPGSLVFSTGTDAAPTVLTERMRINSAGNVGIGDTSPAALFTVGSGDLFQVNSSGQIAAVAGYTQGSGNFSISGSGTFGTGTGAITLNGDTTIAAGKSLAMALGTGKFLQIYSGTETAATISASSLTSGNILSLTSSSTAAAAGNTGLNIAISGANATSGITRYGLQSAVTATNATSGTNVAGYFSASGATTANYGLIVASGNVGIGVAAPTYKFMVDWNGDGTNSAYVDNSNAWTNGSADYAEYFYTKDADLKAGEAVCVDTENDNAVKRCQRSGDNDIIGIISTSPSVLGNAPVGRDKDPNYVKTAMLGQIPGKVSTTENGEIKVGDNMTASAIPGYMRKANAGESTVGVALENFDGTKGTIQILISRRNQSLTVEKVEQAVSENIANMNIKDEVDNIMAEAKENLDMQIDSTGQSLKQIQDSFIEQDSAVASIQEMQIKIQKQMDLIAEQAEIAADFIDSLKVSGIVYRDALGNLNLLDGKISAKDIEVSNSIKAKDIEAENNLKGKNIELSQDVSGTGKIKGGELKSEPISTKEAGEGVKIYITPKNSTEGKMLYYDEQDIKEGESFVVKIDSPALEEDKDIEFNWLIIK
ncbi:MAG TPA: hypothetical protein P5099_01810 [Candidatus Moranbacteria bacterium]|nr:hypothetical protein [Candidatus Moranbacteria bacterium]